MEGIRGYLFNFIDMFEKARDINKFIASNLESTLYTDYDFYYFNIDGNELVDLKINTKKKINTKNMQSHI